MKVIAVSDVHGNFEALARAAERADLLVVLGDLLEYVDYSNPGNGVLGRAFGPEQVSKLADMRAAGRFQEFHDLQAALWESHGDASAAIDEAVEEQYRRALESIGPNSLVTLGNVDVPAIWDRLAPPGLRHLDGEVVEIGGLRFGFVAGGCLRTPPNAGPWLYYDRDRDTFASVLDSLELVDVLCTHLPPDVDDLRFDVRAERLEMYGYGLRQWIEEHQPALSMFGHVHHPRARQAHLGATRCANVGYFSPAGQCFTFDTEAIA